MLDQLSGGRLEIGFGRGSVPEELIYYGQKPAEAQQVYAEAMELIIKGMTEPVLTFQGRFFSFDSVPMEVVPHQKPHPPIWYGVHTPESAERAARRRLRVVSLDALDATRASFDAFRRTWKEMWGDAPLPLMGLGRFVVVAETDDAALAMARRAYPKWYQSFTHLRRLHGGSNAHPRPATFDGLLAAGQGIAGSPQTVTAALRRELGGTGSNYCVGQFAFGDLSLTETLRSIELFAHEVMPQLVDAIPVAAV